MWLLLGLLGSVSALTASDMFIARSSDDDDDSDDPRSSDDPDAPGDTGSVQVGTDYPDVDLPDETPVTVPPVTEEPPDPVLGLFDGLGERVHSSDTYPAPPPDSPRLLDGDDEDDNLAGDRLDDVLRGRGGDDRLAGHGGADWMDGGRGDDSLVGGDGADTLYGGDGNDTLVGGLGDDLLVSGDGASTTMGGDGDDTLVGQAGASFLNGGAGNDLLQAGAGNTLHGGSGSDMFLASGSAQQDAPIQILDYRAAEDMILLDYDPANGMPDLSITFDSATPDLAEIRVAGQVLAQVANAGGLAVSDITLVPQQGG